MNEMEKKRYDEDQIKHNQSFKNRLHQRLSNIARKMSQGASNIFKSLRSHRSKFLGSHRKNHHESK